MFEDQEQASLRKGRLDTSQQELPRGVRHVQGLRHGGQHQHRITDRGQRHDGGTVGEFLLQTLGHLQGQSRLADPPRTGEREQPYVGTAKERGDRCELLLPADERGQGRWATRGSLVLLGQRDQGKGARMGRARRRAISHGRSSTR